MVAAAFNGTERLAKVLKLATEPLPSVPPLSDDPSLEEQVAAWRQHAANYATVALTLREAVPAILQCLEDISSGMIALRAEIRSEFSAMRNHPNLGK